MGSRLRCDYCEPSFAALGDAWRRTGLDVVTIAADRADDPEAGTLIRKKLAAAGLDRNIWAFGAAPPEQLRYAIDPKWRGEMPRSYWFDASGNYKAHSGLVTLETVARFAVRQGNGK